MINTPVFVIFLKKTRLSMDFDGFLAKEPKKLKIQRYTAPLVIKKSLWLYIKKKA
jgi:hypothetical protein